MGMVKKEGARYWCGKTKLRAGRNARKKSAQREPSTPSTRNTARRLEDILEEREKLGSSQTLENVTRKSGKPGSCTA